MDADAYLIYGIRIWCGAEGGAPESGGLFEFPEGYPDEDYDLSEFLQAQVQVMNARAGEVRYMLYTTGYDHDTYWIGLKDRKWAFDFGSEEVDHEFVCQMPLVSDGKLAAAGAKWHIAASYS